MVTARCGNMQKSSGILVEGGQKLTTANEAAMAAPVPPELPPGVRLKSYGLRVWPPRLETERPSRASSWRLDLPRMTAPARRRAATVGASCVGVDELRARQPPVEGIGVAS